MGKSLFTKRVWNYNIIKDLITSYNLSLFYWNCTGDRDWGSKINCILYFVLNIQLLFQVSAEEDSSVTPGPQDDEKHVQVDVDVIISPQLAEHNPKVTAVWTREHWNLNDLTSNPPAVKMDLAKVIHITYYAYYQYSFVTFE